ncbi:hypothetical protein O6H91_Y011300 [Diphasiastrum complanatum]|nr:hypothetical protein O6H91_Y011300 [Diphasiastrum complanatum]
MHIITKCLHMLCNSSTHFIKHLMEYFPSIFQFLVQESVRNGGRSPNSLINPVLFTIYLKSPCRSLFSTILSTNEVLSIFNVHKIQPPLTYIHQPLKNCNCITISLGIT